MNQIKQPNPLRVSPKRGILMIKKYNNAAYGSGIAINDSDEDKKLIIGEVLSGDSEIYPENTTVIFGKYSLYQLVLDGKEYHFIDEDDVLATSNYAE